MKHIIFADAGGNIMIEVDENGIDFLDGKAYFSTTDGIDYIISISDIRRII